MHGNYLGGKIMNIAIVYFSATGNTRKMAEILSSEFVALGAEVDLYNVTCESERKINNKLAGYDALLFGFPVHSLRAPRMMRDWLTTILGEGRKCALFFTYGGFMVHPAHYSTAEILKNQGFIVVSSVEFPGKHTYNIGGWKAFPDRPDMREYILAEEYAKVTFQRFTGDDKQYLRELEKGNFSKEQLDFFESLRFKLLSKLPTRDGESCSMCGLCKSVCPAGAMDDISGNADPEKCIACLGCVAACPENVLHINSMVDSWGMKLEMSKTTEGKLNKQVGRIYL